MALAPLRKYQPKTINVVSMQAVSGAGYPGVASLDILDNVIPYIKGEEPKLNLEPAKMLGLYTGESVAPLPMQVSASCNRVPVLDAHLVCVTAIFEENPSIAEIITAWDSFIGPDPVPSLPTAPAQPVIYTHEEDRPQPRRDRDAGNGMSTVVGRLRPNTVFGGVDFIALAHNTIRGAAGCSILNAELLRAKGYLESVAVEKIAAPV